MVNKNDDRNPKDDDIEITSDSTGPDETELIEEEEYTGNKLKKLRTELLAAQEETRNLREELQRQKADFLNARRRLDEDRENDKKRTIEKHVEKLLPLCDSFRLAMLDHKAWENTDPSWRKGIEGIHQQLQNILTQYHVEAFDPGGQPFDPMRHEALGSCPVDKEAEHHQVIQVLQLGYEMKDGNDIRIVRPARVIVGEYTKSENK